MERPGEDHRGVRPPSPRGAAWEWGKTPSRAMSVAGFMRRLAGSRPSRPHHEAQLPDANTRCQVLTLATRAKSIPTSPSRKRDRTQKRIHVLQNFALRLEDNIVRVRIERDVQRAARVTNEIPATERRGGKTAWLNQPLRRHRMGRRRSNPPQPAEGRLS